MAPNVPVPRPTGGAPRASTQRPLPPLRPGLRGPWTRPPKLDEDKWRVGKVGKGPRRGQYVAKRIAPPRAKPKADPYAGNPDAALLRQYEGEEWAQNLIRALRSEQTHHEGYVANQVMPWQSGAMGALAGINQQAQANYTAQTGAMAQGLAQAAGAQPGTVQGVSGGAVTSPNAYQQAASAQGMANQASTMGQMAAWQGLMGTLQPTTYSQGQIAALSDYARGLPVLYAEKRAERIDAIDQYLAEREQAKAELALEVAKFEEAQRAARVGEAISATNAQTNAAIAFANLGIRAADSAADNAPDAPIDPNAVPHGFVLLPNGDIVRDPNVPQATSGGSGGGGGGSGGSGGSSGRAPSPARGEYPPNKLRKEGFRPLPPKAGPKYRRIAVRATDGSLWYKPGSGGGSSSGGSTGGASSAGRSGVDLIDELARLYDKGDDGGWEWRYRDDPQGAGREIALWIRQNKSSFVKPGTRQVDYTKLNQVLRTVGGTPMGVAQDILRRGYITPDGRSWR